MKKLNIALITSVNDETCAGFTIGCFGLSSGNF